MRTDLEPWQLFSLDETGDPGRRNGGIGKGKKLNPMINEQHQLSRRRFLAASVTASLSSTAVTTFAAKDPKVKITSIDVFPIRYPTVGYFKFFEGPRGTYGRSAVVVKITGDDGTVGWGQSVPVYTWSYETLESVKTTIERGILKDASRSLQKYLISASSSPVAPSCKTKAAATSSPLRLWGRPKTTASATCG